MKIVIKRIESINRKGVNKETGKTWHIDATNIIADVAFSDEKFDENNKTIAFGFKDIVYQAGEVPSSDNYQKMGLDKLKGLLPCECEVEMSQGLDSFGNPKVCITDVKPLTKKAVNNG